MNPSDVKLLYELNVMESQCKTAITFEQIKIDRINTTRNEIFFRNNMVPPQYEVDKENKPPTVGSAGRRGRPRSSGPAPKIYQVFRNNIVPPQYEVDKENKPPTVGSAGRRGRPRSSGPAPKIYKTPKGPKNNDPKDSPKCKLAKEIAKRIKDNKWTMPPMRIDQCPKCRMYRKPRDEHVCNIDQCFLGCACGFLTSNTRALYAHTLYCKKRNPDLAKYLAQLGPCGVKGEPPNTD